MRPESDLCKGQPQEHMLCWASTLWLVPCGWRQGGEGDKGDGDRSYKHWSSKLRRCLSMGK